MKLLLDPCFHSWLAEGGSVELKASVCGNEKKREEHGHCYDVQALGVEGLRV